MHYLKLKGFGDLYKSKKKSRKKSEYSKEQVINQAIQLHLKGNIPEAITSYQKLISQECNDHRVFSNYGIILSDLGKLKEAEISYRKAIEINPEYAIAYSNMGIIFSDLGKLKEAEISYRKAIEINPEYAMAYCNLGNLLRELGKLKEAEQFTRKAIEINPEYAMAYCNLGNILKDLGKLQEAFDAFIKVIEINPTFSNIYTSITFFLKDSDIYQLDKSKLKGILNILLERNDIYHKELFNAFNFAYGKEIISNLEELDSEISKIELLVSNKVIINALKKITFKDIKLEKVLTRARRYLCIRIDKDVKTINFSELNFIISLAEQCFLNEYVYSLTKEESLSLISIINRCIDSKINETYISILACYFPLYKILNKVPALKSFKSSNQKFKALTKLQILEPLKEIQLSKNIKKLGSIDNNVSLKVKSQYEENPYPRWRYGNPSKVQKLNINQVINIGIKPNSIKHYGSEEKLKVLIAGCGTGNQILQSQRYKNAHITCIDLSLSSLSYAQRKINELGINNVELIEMDILEVSLLEKQFDVIECGGVLHHMDNPSEGLRKLLDILTNNGYMKLGLYSELSRKDVVKARDYITSKNLLPNDDDIKDFREDVFSGKIIEISNLINWGDFYTMSECRDLCFHTKEHRFKINQLQEIFQSNKLIFLGFSLQQSVKSQYQKYFPEDHKQTNLQNWAKFEEIFPNTFKGMYQFWVCKKKI